MRRIALLSLAHDRGKLVASIAGVAFAATLVLVQIGIYAGFLEASSAIIRRMGGDLWVMARGTEVLDTSDALSPASRIAIAAHPCVRRVQGLVHAFAIIHKPTGARDAVIVVGFEPRRDHLVPWNLVAGLPADLEAPMRVSLDSGDLKKLQIRTDPLHTTLEIRDQQVQVAALSEGIRAFTLTPYIFTSLANARRLTGLGSGQAHYWIVDLTDPGTADEVKQWIESRHDLQVIRTADWVKMTEDYWVGGSGAGSAIAFSAILGLVVGAVVVGQTLYSITKEHLKELATLKALGANSWELIGFVGWQASFLAAVGGLLGLCITFGVRALVAKVGLNVVLSPGTAALGFGAVLLMCVAAAGTSVRAVFALEAAEVFK